MTRTLLFAALLACAQSVVVQPASAADTPLTTAAERSGFINAT